jgi:hypothetical protein
MKPNVAGQPLSRMQWLAVCCWVSGMQIQQTAYSLGVKPNTALKYLERARAKRGTTVPRLLVNPGPPPHQPRTGDTP